MYNSSIKGQSLDVLCGTFNEVPHKIFFNDMSKNFWNNGFDGCDVIYSEIAWAYGYPRFNEKAGNEPNKYTEYLNNIHSLIMKMNVPSFIICGKNVSKHFPEAKQIPFAITTSGTSMDGCTLYVWNFDVGKITCDNSDKLTDFLARNFDKCLDFSCGYGEHLLKFKDFVACDIDRNCLAYLSILYEERRKHGEAKN